MTDPLGNVHKRALLTLMGVGRAVSNTELHEIFGFRIDGEVRYTLNRRWVTSQRKGNKPFVHELTDDGWAWCVKELAADSPTGGGPFGGAMYAVLGGIDRFLQRAGLGLRDLFEPVAPLEARIREAYHKLAKDPGDWVRLADLRRLLNGASKADVDAVLEEMSGRRRAHLVPKSDRKSVTAADRAAAIQLGDDDNHLIVIEGP